MKIFLDFDDTIFNTGKFKEDFASIFNQNGITNEEFNRTYYSDLAKGVKGYNPKKHLELINWPDEYTKQETIQKLEKILENLEKYVFEDFYELAAKINKNNLFLISFGKMEFQEIKIKNSGVLKYFADYKVVEREDKGDYIQKIVGDNPGSIFLVDDRPEQLAKAKEKNPGLIPIRIKRKEGRYADLKDIIKTETIYNLSEMTGLIEYFCQNE
ncbi:MAG: hypothetical protein ACOCUF_00765 [Patescibacteria group bacterium]